VTRTIDYDRYDSLANFRVLDEKGNQILGQNDIYYDADLNAYKSTINFSAENEKKTFTFMYTVYGGIGYFDDYDELYWNILPSDRDVPVDKVNVKVSLPSGVSREDMQHAVYSEGSNLKSGISPAANFEYSGEDLGSYSNFTIVAGWPVGVVYSPGVYRIESDPPGATVLVNGVEAVRATPVALRADGIDLANGRNEIELKKFGYEAKQQTIDVKKGARETVTIEMETTWWLPFFYLLVALWFLHPLAMLLFMILHWHKRGRDPKGRKTIIARYSPPNDLPPTLVGTLVDERVDMHEITATIVDLARRGYLKIKELEKKRFQAQDYELTKVKEFEGDTTLFNYERDFLKYIFGSKETTKISSMKNKFYKHLPSLKDDIYSEVTKMKFFQKNPKKKRAAYYGGGSALLIVGFVSAFFLGFGIPLVLDGIIVLIFAKFMPKRTPEGVIATEHALGFKEYLYTAERFRVQKLTPEMFEKFLPYAMVFKIEKEWAKKFENIYKGQPDWYQGAPGSVFTPVVLANSMNSFANTASTSFTTSPGGGGSGASGGSGFSGGFSGGGGGGGGMSAG